MANTKSAIKAVRKSARNAVRNKTTISRLKTLHKKFEQATEKGDAAEARATGIKRHDNAWVIIVFHVVAV